MKIDYTYRSTCGKDMKGEGDYHQVRHLLEDYKDSCTPISSINGVPVDLTDFLSLIMLDAEADIAFAERRLRELEREFKHRQAKRTRVLARKKRIHAS